MCRFPPSPAPGRTAPSCTTASTRDQPPHRPGELFLIDSGAQYAGRHDRHHPDRRGRRARPSCVTASPACSRATSRLRAPFPGGTTGAQLDPWLGSPCGRPGRSTTAPATASAAPLGPRGPAAHLQAGTLALKPGCPLERARLLQARRVRHPHREPGAGDEAAESRHGSRWLGFETLTLVPIDRRLIARANCSPTMKWPGLMAITRACARH